MKIVHSGTIDVECGGIAHSTYLTIKGLEKNDVDASLLMVPLDDHKKMIANDIDIIYTKEHYFSGRWEYIPKIEKTLKEFDVDLFHIQGLWLHLNHSVARCAMKKKIPYIFALRGMLYPQALTSSYIVKKIALTLYQRKDLQQASCIQTTCIEEMKFYRELGFTNPVAVLPNPTITSDSFERPISTKGKFRVGYLGRVHPRKHIERLIYAFDTLRTQLKDAELLIIGSGDKHCEQLLRDEVSRLRLTNVHFTGFLTGKEKDATIMSLSVLVVPSDFENFGNIVPEALIRGVPVIATKGMPWQELEEFHCGWWIDNDQDSINKALLQVLNLSEDERIAMGMNGKRLVQANYSVEAMGAKMRILYEWILNGGTKPNFVYFG